MGSTDDLPQRIQPHDIQTEAENAFRSALERENYFIIQQEDKADYGTDFQIEARRGTDITNFRIHVQLKGTITVPNSDESISISVPRTNLNYLLGQPESIYACFHTHSKTLLVKYATEVFQEYEHNHGGWQNQQDITVRFIRKFNKEFQRELNKRVLVGGKEEKNRRLHWAATPPEMYSSEVRKSTPIIEIPHKVDDAKRILSNLFENCEDSTISYAFEKFEAILDDSSGEMDMAYMAEINLGLNGSEFDLPRVQKSLQILLLALDRGQDPPCAIHYCIGNGLLALKKYDEAIKHYQVALDLAEGFTTKDFLARCLKNKGSAHQEKGDFEVARQCYEGALNENQDLPEAHFALGLWHRKHSQDFKLALSHFDQVISDSTTPHLSSAPQAWKIELHFLLNDEDSAFREIRSTLPFSRDCAWIYPWCASLVARFGRTSSKSAELSLKFWRRYIQNFQSDLYAKREQFMCLSLLHSHGENTSITLHDFSLLAEELTEKGDSETALIWDRLGHWAQDEGNWSAAESAYRKAFNLSPSEFGYCFGTSLNFLGKFKEALPILLNQAKNINKDAMSWFQVAVAKEGIGDYDGCILAYEEALSLDADYALAWFNLGGIFWNRKEIVRAIEIWSEALDRFPEHDLARKLLNDIPLLRQGEI